ncbi:hypothetical protein I4I84_06565 [Pseudonocardia sp. KRD-182]|uniref:hypothetical protein n=1 Tax=Pseudonocardia oceani TaxID=2792013 RepID=UPI001C49E089|nr:hypothetical protein [Pseudonocardia oceani]MBW0108399.1 hypothetical protein [Pseudonocardia oceani]
MDPKARRNATARAVLLWLDIEGDNYPLVEDFLSLPAAHVSDDPVGNDELVRTVRWLDARGLVDGPRIDEVPYPAKLCLTDAGRIVLIEQDGWVEPDAAPQTTPATKPSPNAVAQAFLRWLYDHNREQPTPAKFLDDSRSNIGGHQVDNDEMVEAVELLESKGLVSGPKSWGVSIPLRIKLTGNGRICVVDHDADPSRMVRTWGQVSHGEPAVTKTVTVGGTGNYVIAHSENVSQSPVDAGQRPDIVVEYQGSALGGGYRIELKMVGGPEQLSVSIGVAVLEPQEGVTASVNAGGEDRRMVRGLTRKIEVSIEPPATNTAVVIEVIATCRDLDPPGERWSLHRSLTIPRPARIHRAQFGRVPRSTEVRRHPDR